MSRIWESATIAIDLEQVAAIEVQKKVFESPPTVGYQTVVYRKGSDIPIAISGEDGKALLVAWRLYSTSLS